MSKMILGIDEAGRGPLSGSVFAAAVILDPNKPIHGLADSKKLSEKRRDELYQEIISKAFAYNIASASVLEIDTYNILQATLLAMRRALEPLVKYSPHVLIDGNKSPSDMFDLSFETIIQGDSKIIEISAASILAKVTRDKECYLLDKLYPEYGFAKHKGYGTKLHASVLEKLGPIDGIHRKSFKLKSQQSFF